MDKGENGEDISLGDRKFIGLLWTCPSVSERVGSRWKGYIEVRQVATLLNSPPYPQGDLEKEMGNTWNGIALGIILRPATNHEKQEV